MYVALHFIFKMIIKHGVAYVTLSTIKNQIRINPLYSNRKEDDWFFPFVNGKVLHRFKSIKYMSCLGFIFHLLLIGKYSNIPPKEKNKRQRDWIPFITFPEKKSPNLGNKWTHQLYSNKKTPLKWKTIEVNWLGH